MHRRHRPQSNEEGIHLAHDLPKHPSSRDQRHQRHRHVQHGHHHIRYRQVHQEEVRPGPHLAVSADRQDDQHVAHDATDDEDHHQGAHGDHERRMVVVFGAVGGGRERGVDHLCRSRGG